jgi:flavin-dependent dehydrogenase
METTMNDGSCDIAVLGGGPAGAAAAIALRQRTGRSVALLERSSYDEPRIGETLPPDGQSLLVRLGLWEAFLSQNHLRSGGTCSSWGSATLGYNDSLFSPWGTGWHLDRLRFDRMLADQAVRHGVTLCTGAELSHAERLADGGHRLHVKRAGDGRTESLRALFVVDATGRRAAFAKAQGARRITVDRTFALYGFYRLREGRSFDSYVLVEAAEEGFWYSARVPGDRVVVGLLGDADSLRGLKPTAEPWLAMLERAPRTRARLAACEFTEEPLVSLPADVSRLDRMHGDDWIAVGDAACSFDPLSSQGIAKALRTAWLAAGAVHGHFQGEPGALQGYEETLQRQFQAHLVTRDGYYRMERRWPTAPFWIHRERVLGRDGGSPVKDQEEQKSTGPEGKGRPAVLAGGAMALVAVAAVGAYSLSSKKDDAGPGQVKAAASAASINVFVDGSNGVVSPPNPVVPRNGALMRPVTDSAQVKDYQGFYAAQNVNLPDVDASSLTKLPPRYLDIAHNGLNVSSGNYNTSLVCQSCHDANWKASGTQLGFMTYWAQASETAQAAAPPPGNNPIAANWSLYGDWSASIKALAGRDPVFLAQVESTRNLSPNQPEQVDNLCLRCHSPLGQRQAENEKKTFDHYMLYAVPPGTTGYTNPYQNTHYTPGDEKYGALGRDGVTCDGCHSQAPAQGLPWDGQSYDVFYGSTSASMYGGQVSNRLKTKDDPGTPAPYPFSASMNTRAGTVVAPHQRPVSAPMAAAGLSVEEAKAHPTAQFNSATNNYLQESLVCGSCHIVMLPQVPDKYAAGLKVAEVEQRGGGKVYKRPASCSTAPDATFTGDFLTDPCVGLAYEQTTYFEWANSGYAPHQKTCTTCHMPSIKGNGSAIGTQLAQVDDDVKKFYGDDPQQLEKRPYARHALLGINLFVHEMFQQFSDVLGIQYYKDDQHVVPPFLQDPSIASRTGNIVPNPGAETGNTQGWSGVQIQAVERGAVQQASAGGGTVAPNHGRYFFQVTGSGGSATLDVPLSAYAAYFGDGPTTVTWGAAVHCPTGSTCPTITLTPSGGQPSSLTPTPSATSPWSSVQSQALTIARGTSSLTISLPAGSIVDDLFLFLSGPNNPALSPQDGSRNYTVANNLLNAEQSILDLAVNMPQGQLDPANPVSAVSLAVAPSQTPPPAGKLGFDVTITNNTGHKFPTGAGFRRAFIQFEVLDASNKVLWASGQPNKWGAICNGNCPAPDGADKYGNVLESEFTTDPAKLQPHYQVIDDPGKVQIYEVRGVDDYNHVTSKELQQFKPIKDNRLLPLGFMLPTQYGATDELLGLKRQEMARATVPELMGQSDPDYAPSTPNGAAGSDKITYTIPASAVQGWKSVRVRLNYQTIPPGYLKARYGEYTDGRVAMQRLIYMTSHLNTQTGLKYQRNGTDIDLMSSWSMVLNQATYANP